MAGLPVKFMIDSGSSANALTESVYNKLLEKNETDSRLLSIDTLPMKKLTAYASSTPLEIIAKIVADLWIDNLRPHGAVKFYAIKGARQCLLGKETALSYSVLRLGTSISVEAANINSVSAAKTHVTQFPKFNFPPVVINIDTKIKPRKCTYSNRPLAWEQVIRERLQQMEDTGIIEELKLGMDTSYCSSMIAVPKGENDIRLVVDLRGPNKCIIREPHNMPTFEKVVSQLKGSSVFSTIDLTNAFSHIELHENSRHITNFFSGEKFYRYKRLPFGLCNAPDIFQKAMECILEGCEGKIIYLDDILVFGSTKLEHDIRLKSVLDALAAHNVELNKSKCRFGKESVTFLGFVISKDGYRVTDERMECIKSFRTPATTAEVRSFLGLVNFVDRFIMNRADKTHKLYDLVRSQTFVWTPELNNEFEFLRGEALRSIKTLGFYDPEEPLDLMVDASPVGLGAILYQKDGIGRTRIIGCVSKALTATEARYPQTQREALSVVWACERFQFYTRGRDFTIWTDSEANEFIYGGEHRIGKRAVTRAEAWALRLLPFSFKIRRIPGESNVADALSRLINESQKDPPFEEDEPRLIGTIFDESTTPITWDMIASASRLDEEITEIRAFLPSRGKWPRSLEKFRHVQNNLQMKGDVVMFRNKMLVPKALQEQVIKTAHAGHFGMCSMKKMIRQSFWWPGVNKDVENKVLSCDICQKISRIPKPIPLQSRQLPEGPWVNIQIDFLKLPGFGSEQFLMTTDTYSRMFWIVEMARTDARTTIKALWDIFAIWGRPDVIQSDNGPPFNAPEFTEFWNKQGVKHNRTVPYCPAMNGMIERKNEVVLRCLRAAAVEKRNWRDALFNYVHKYNNEIPHSSTGFTPFELMVGRRYHGFFPVIELSKEKRVRDAEVRINDAIAKERSKKYADTRRGAQESDIKAGDWVLVANKHRRNKMESTFLHEPFKVTNRYGPKLTVQSDSGTKYSRWVSDVKRYIPEEKSNKTVVVSDDKEVEIGDWVTSRTPDELPLSRSNFKSTRFKVIHIDGDDALLRNEDGCEVAEPLESVLRHSPSWNDFQKRPCTAMDPDEDGAGSLYKSQDIVVRPKRKAKAPGHLSDYELYNIFG